MAKIVPQNQVSATYYVQHPLDLIKGLSSDVVAFAVLFLAVGAYGLYRGKESLVSLILSLYIAMAAYSSSDFLKSFLPFKQNTSQIFSSKLIVYLILVVLVNLIVGKIIGVGFPMSKVRNWVEIAALSVAVVASFIVIAFNTLSLLPAYTPSLLSGSLLTSGNAVLCTLIGSFIIIFFATR